MNLYSPYHDPDSGIVGMSIDAKGSWVHINEFRKQRRTYRKVLRDLNKAHNVLWKMVFLHYDKEKKP